ncbi:hypothetical protein C8F04DRAFT_1253401 [Mycena alexandri]|uniref:Uncharacterized protein n=1 Tax=Mycena alexandri TaxID=1745969 RepID=A0AAD6XA12_9AGAR|nr:hypothetical protein C8F04DRAFT_1253401 [Mycena alexandri]
MAAHCKRAVSSVPARTALQKTVTVPFSSPSTLAATPSIRILQVRRCLVPAVATPGSFTAPILPGSPGRINHLSGEVPGMVIVGPFIQWKFFGICGCIVFVLASGLFMIVPLNFAPGVSCSPPNAWYPPSHLARWFLHNGLPSRTLEVGAGPLPPFMTFILPPQPLRQRGSSSGSSPSRKKPRLAGNPRAYSTPVAALNDFSPSSSHLDVPQTVQITVGILPKVLSTSDNNDVLDLSPVYFWKTGDELEAVQRRLETAKLTFRVDANPTGPVFETINDGFIAHCALQNIVFVTPSPVLVNGVPISSPNSKPWVLTGPKGRVGNRSWVEDPKCLTAFTFTIAALRASPYSNTSNYLGKGIFIFIDASQLVFFVLSWLHWATTQPLLVVLAALATRIIQLSPGTGTLQPLQLQISWNLLVLCQSSTRMIARMTSNFPKLMHFLPTGFGAGYIQVRQTLKVESVARRIKVEHPTCSVSVQDISVWAGVNPATYANNLTVAKNARATLQYLSYFSTTPGPSLQSSEDRERDQKLQGFLAQLFSTTDLGEHWRRNVDGLEAGGAKVQLVKTRIERFSRLITVYKEEVFEMC